MLLDQVFGYIGCSLLVTTLLPQIYKNYKSKTMEDVSIIFILLQNLTCIIFLIYGCLLQEYPLIIANAIVEFQCLILLSMKFIYDKDGELPVNKAMFRNTILI
jgi:MtN3 and saliva related transmembrane protein